MKDRPTVLLVGNPNCGKTSLFNELSGCRAFVGNYPGGVIEAARAGVETPDGPVELIDLPGVYRLGGASLEEKLAMDYLCRSGVRAIVSVVDSLNLDRHLYLTLQLWHFRLPVILVLNMSDEADAARLSFDIPAFEAMLGVRIVRTDALRRKGMEELLACIGQAAYRPSGYPAFRKPEYGEQTEQVLEFIAHTVESSGLRRQKEPVSYIAARLLDGNAAMVARYEELGEEGRRLLEMIEDCRTELSRQMGLPAPEILSSKRYGLIRGLLEEVQGGDGVSRIRRSTAVLDGILTHKYWGIPLFLLLMYVVFFAAFTLGNPLVDLVRSGFDALGGWLAQALDGHPMWQSLIVKGIIGGVGGVVSFVPTIAILFACLSLLEGTGYMARAAFLMDRFMHKMGLHGKSFIPMLIGFGCNVPAVMATRSIESKKDRLTTIFVLPFMSCSARLLVFALFIEALVAPAYQSITMWGLYLFGILVAVVGARLLKSTLFRGGDETFIMELPPYRLPSPGAYLHSVWERVSGYLCKAGTFILLGVVVLWFLNTYPQPEQGGGIPDSARMEQSYAARAGKFFEPLSQYAGMDWQANSAMIGAFSAKELLVAQLGILFASPGEPDAAVHASDEEKRLDARRKISAHYTLPQALGIMTFALLALPCIATVAVVRKETGSWLFTIGQFAALNIVGFGLAVAVYQTAAVFLRA